MIYAVCILIKSPLYTSVCLCPSVRLSVAVNRYRLIGLVYFLKPTSNLELPAVPALSSFRRHHGSDSGEWVSPTSLSGCLPVLSN